MQPMRCNLKTTHEISIGVQAVLLRRPSGCNQWGATYGAQPIGCNLWGASGAFKEALRVQPMGRNLWGVTYGVQKVLLRRAPGCNPWGATYRLRPGWHDMAKSRHTGPISSKQVRSPQYKHTLGNPPTP